MKRIVGMIVLLTGCTMAQVSRPHKLTAVEKTAVSVVRSMRDSLSDPESFRVSSAAVVLNTTDDADTIVVCVDGRTKNALGGYVSVVGEGMGFTNKGIGISLGVHPAADESSAVARLKVAKCGDPTFPNVDVTDAVKAALKADREKE